MNTLSIVKAKVKAVSMIFGFVFGALLFGSVGLFFRDFLNPIDCGCLGAWIGAFLGYVYGKLLIRLI